MKEKKIYVYENFNSLTPNLIGTLYVSFVRGKEVFSFEYCDDFLKRNINYIIDPDLPLCKGRIYLNDDKKIFGLFADTCPDRWGRLLINRMENMIAMKEKRSPKELYESDYLLSIYDYSRMGAIRFKESLDGEFKSDNKDLSIPNITSIRSLEEASRVLEEGNIKNIEKWIMMLIGPGSSLGGARPKATIIDNNKELWIAKFPSRNDEINVGAWEKVVNDLAKLCGLNVPESNLENFSKLGSTFMTKRFDRNKEIRIHFASAMTMLGKTDGNDFTSSYLDIADFIKQNGINVKKDLLELWKRIVFNLAISNRDDHLRNHGFILKNGGWALAPLYDINPVPYGNSLSLNINKESNIMDIDLVIETAKYYGIIKEDAIKIAKEIFEIVNNNWEKIALKYKIQLSEIEYMRPAFKNI